jgi:glutamate/tyrosine decarboxylase-like PLP-dependent enzyme
MNQTYEALDVAFNGAKKWLSGLENRSVSSTASLESLREKIHGKLQENGMSSTAVVDQLIEATKDGLHGSASGRFFAWVIGGSLPSALAADWLTSTWDQNAALYACGPAVSVIEETAGEWIKDLLHLPIESSFAFTTGCQLAHFTCLASARSSVLKKVGWNINEDGLFGAPKIRVLTSEHRHASVDRAIRYLGLGNKSLRALSTDSDGRIGLENFKSVLKESDQPTIVVLNAADLNIGAFDAFDKLIPIAKESGAWVHIDGAFGLFARASEKLRHFTNGIELADSWATDGHKWLNVPFDCGIAIVRDRQAHREAMTISASYIAAESNARDQIDWNPEWSRRARGVPVYAALRELGKDGVSDLVDRCTRYCREIVLSIGILPGANVLWEPQLNQGLIRFLDSRPGASEEDHDKRTDEVIAKLNKDGTAFFSSTTWRGKRAMRVSVVNWRTSESDVQRTVESAQKVILSFR